MLSVGGWADKIYHFVFKPNYKLVPHQITVISAMIASYQLGSDLYFWKHFYCYKVNKYF